MRYKELFSIRAVKKLPEVDFNAISNIPKDQAIYFILSNLEITKDEQLRQTIIKDLQ